MLLREAIHLIQTKEIQNPSHKIWADLGCGSGLFTRALSELLPASSMIYAVDRNLSTFDPGPAVNYSSIQPVQADFLTEQPNLQNLDGILMANSLHFVADKKGFLEKTYNWFQNYPLYLIVEYDTDMPSHWIPYPVSFKNLGNLFQGNGKHMIRKIGVKNSLYNRADLYSALIYYSPA